jgi:prepilin-type N-terminal cleavage/methylation domain-containing protein
MEKKMKRAAQKGFTLIELLIVIGLLGALTSLILPSLSADREEALGDVCDYNQAGTLRTLQQYYDIYGIFPNNLHIGLDAAASGDPMEGLPEAQAVNMVSTGDGYTAPSAITLAQAQSLYAAGITQVSFGTGYNLVPIGAVSGDTIGTVGTVVYPTVAKWEDDEGEAITFNGISITDWEKGVDSGVNVSPYGEPGRVLCFWITPTLDWNNHKTNGASVNQDWTKGAVDLKISLPGQCPIPATNLDGEDAPDFAYYMAYILAFDNGDKAVLIGTSCPEDGILNP